MNSFLLLVEDNEDDAFLMTRALQSAGLNSEHLYRAKDGREALDYLLGEGTFADRERPPLPTLIILDLKLPQISGFEVLATVRKNIGLHHPIVIVLSSSKHPTDILKSYELGANSYVAKPSSLDKLSEFASLLRAYWLQWNQPAF